MTTIKLDETLKFAKTHFKTLEEFQLYVIAQAQADELTAEHKSILDERLKDFYAHPERSITVDELFASIKRKGN